MCERKRMRFLIIDVEMPLNYRRIAVKRCRNAVELLSKCCRIAAESPPNFRF